MIKSQFGSKFSKKFKSIIFISVFLAILIKNLKLITRSKTSALIILLGPLLIIFLVGASFNTSSIYDIRIGTYSLEYNDLTNSLLNELSDKQFTIVKFEGIEECVNNLEKGNVHVCSVFPASLSVGGEDPVIFYVDNSRMNLVWVIIDAISSKVKVKSSQLSTQLTQNILDALSDTQTKLVDKTSVVSGLANNSIHNKAELNFVSSELSSLTFNLNDVGVGDIRRELDELIIDNNLSAGMFSSLISSISRAENKSIDILEDLNLMAAVRDTVVTNLGDLSNSLNDDLNSLDAIRSTITDIKKKIEDVSGTSADTIVTPIKTEITPVSIDSTHLNFLFPTLVILIIMFIGVLLGSLQVVREKIASAYFRNFITPISDVFFLVGDYFTNFLVVFLQLIIIFVVAAFFFKGVLDAYVLLNSLVVIIIIITVFVLIGMWIGYLFKSEETSTLAAISFASISLFFSSTILPLETLPTYIKDIAQFNPFVISENILRGVLLFNSDLFGVFQGLGLLIFYIFILVIFVYITRRITKYYHS